MTRTYDLEERKTAEQEYIDRIIRTVADKLGAGPDEIQDVSEDKRYFKKDIDVLIQDVSYEMKMDFYDSGFCFLEVISNSESGALGWLFVSQAQYLVYAFPLLGKAYIADMKKLRDWFLENIYWFVTTDKKRRVRTENDEGYSYYSFGYLANLNELEREGIFKKFNLLPS